MVGSNKILTVSYGTFSCTLEGFEDSFGTMKAIAEYFRDLAADDRYFGAVPPVPDVEMLARIAEREVARRVEARMDGSGIVLRVGQATDAAPQAQPVAATPTPVASAPVSPHAETMAPLMPPVPVAPVVIAPRHFTPHQPTPAAQVFAPKPANVPMHPDADSVAAKLQRIRAVVGKGSAGFAAEDDAEDGSATLARLVADPVETFASVADAEPLPAIQAETIAPEDDVAAILAEVAADAAGAEVAADAAGAEVAADAAAEAESKAGIEPVQEETSPEAVEEIVAEAASPAGEPAAEEVSEPVAAAPAPIRARVIKVRRADLERAVALGMLVEDKATTPPTEASGDAGAAVAGDDDQADPDFPEATTESFAEEEIAADIADLDDLARLDGLASLTGTTPLSAADEAELLAELEAVEREAETHPEATAAVDEEAFAETAETANDTDLKLMNILARVAETDADEMADSREAEPVVAGAGDQPDESLSGLADAIRAADSGTVGAEAVEDYAEENVEDAIADNDNLFAEDPASEDLAADDEVAADAFDAFAAETDAADGIADEAEAEPAIAHSHLRAEPEADEASMSRIMSEAEAQLSEPEVSRRRDAIAQLRAAVAATEAARRLGEAPVETDTSAENAFRDDLRQVVRPRRPMTPTAEVRSERPKPAPLKLVASQRIDLPQPAPRSAPAATMPIRPRRVTITPEEETVAAPSVALASVAAASRSQAGSFAEFAAEMGATSLSDLLEAAAAYTAFVEGSEDFSRPQLLKKVTQMVPDQFTREDGLRSFGTLLREGRIMRTRAGRFQVSEETRFKPERRAG